MTLKLVVFDVDGTLIDSQADILGAMAAAFGAEHLPVPDRVAVLSIVGLSLPQAMARLAPDTAAAQQARLVQAYKDAYADQRRRDGAGAAPFYPGLRRVLDNLRARDDVLLGIATGKSRRGLSALIEAHGLEHAFQTTQTADDHPSKPHPAMVQAALAETGADAAEAVMIGDTSYDIDMGQAAGIATIGVTWGYHPREALAHAGALAEDAAGLTQAIAHFLKGTT